MTVVFLFVPAGYGLVLIDGGTLFNLLPRKVDEKHLSIRVKVAECMWRDQYLSTREPSARIGDQIANNPIFVVEVEVSDVPNLAVGRPQFLSVTLLNAV
jgi:hypothetical protein